MIKLTLSDAAQLLQLPAPASDIEFQGISIDTRTVKPGNLFLAIKGARVDGHDLIESAREKGAAAALVTRITDNISPQLLVPDVILALGKLASHWRNQFDLPIIAITGSNGKTTLKNMMASILIAACNQNRDSVLATVGNFNNDLGLPLTLTQLNKDHRYAAIEMGMNHFGEIKYLSDITRPSIAIINNAASAHLEGIGDVAGVARAKGEIFIGLQASGIAILNRDDDFFDYWKNQIDNRQYISFGTHPNAHVRAELPSSSTPSLIQIETPKGKIDIQSSLLGKHNVMNMLAATAAALSADIDFNAIKTGLEHVAPAQGRLQIHELKNNIKLIDDTYNANPLSVKAAVDTLSTFSGKKILVLGDMKELGDTEKSLHQDAGDHIKHAGIDYLFTYGDLTKNTSERFGEGAYHFHEQEQLVKALHAFLSNQTIILVKGSRSMHMEKIVANLIETL